MQQELSQRPGRTIVSHPSLCLSIGSPLSTRYNIRSPFWPSIASIILHLPTLRICWYPMPRPGLFVQLMNVCFVSKPPRQCALESVLFHLLPLRHGTPYPDNCDSVIVLMFSNRILKLIFLMLPSNSETFWDNRTVTWTTLMTYIIYLFVCLMCEAPWAFL